MLYFNGHFGLRGSLNELPIQELEEKLCERTAESSTELF